MPDHRTFSRITFRGRTGHIVAPWISGAGYAPAIIRHSAAVPPWNDHDIHLHTDSEEYYFVFQGELHVLVDGATMTLKPHEALMIKPGVPHAVVGGMGPIEHFVLRMLAAEDRRAVGRIPAGHAAIVGESERALRAEWGCRVPLTGARYQNCWLFGAGQAHFHSDVMCLAYLDFPSAESLGTDRHSHRLHLHRESWEFYVVLRGTRVLRIEQELVNVSAGEVLAVPPQVKHVLQRTQTPLKGFTFRVPLLNDKVEF